MGIVDDWSEVVHRKDSHYGYGDLSDDLIIPLKDSGRSKKAIRSALDFTFHALQQDNVRGNLYIATSIVYRHLIREQDLS